MSFIMGTAGHIDHGKTALIKTLTGIDCDRLQEEKKRGITIELGFAFTDLGGQRLGIVDVPGHERFVKHMVAGAAGIDFVLMVIAADEAVMPQTREHLDICTLLGVKAGIIVLTKIDLVDDEWLELVENEVRREVENSFLAEAPMVKVSALKNIGLETLKKKILELTDNLSPERAADLTRLPVDRVFTLKGHGTVATGTLMGGSLETGREVRIYPGETMSKIRSLQVHGEQVNRAEAGNRTAVNLHGLSTEDVHRGDVLARPNTLFPSMAWDVELTCLHSSPRPIKHRTELHFHHGARECLAGIYLLDRDKLQPGESAVAQVRFSSPMAGVFGDRCVLRSFSPLQTIGGGRLLNPLSRKIKRFSPQVQTLEALGTKDVKERILLHFSLAGEKGLSLRVLRVLTGVEMGELEKMLQTMSSRQKVFLYDKEERSYITASVVDELSRDCAGYLRAIHSTRAARGGVAKGEVMSGWKRELPVRLKQFILDGLHKSGDIEMDREGIRLVGHKASVSKGLEEAKETVARLYEQAGITPPMVKEVLREAGVDEGQGREILQLLQGENTLVKVKENLYFSAGAVDGLLSSIQTYFQKHEDLSPAGFKEITGLSRKYAIPLLEYLDREKITIRVGDVRKLRKRS